MSQVGIKAKGQKRRQPGMPPRKPPSTRENGLPTTQAPMRKETKKEKEKRVNALLEKFAALREMTASYGPHPDVTTIIREIRSGK